jgi:hypothetical protein
VLELWLACARNNRNTNAFNAGGTLRQEASSTLQPGEPPIVLIGPLSRTTFRIDHGEAGHDPRSRPVAESHASGMYQTTTDLSRGKPACYCSARPSSSQPLLALWRSCVVPLHAGTTRASKHLPGYSGHVPKTMWGRTGEPNRAASVACSKRSSLVIARLHCTRVVVQGSMVLGPTRATSSTRQQTWRLLSKGAFPATVATCPVGASDAALVATTRNAFAAPSALPGSFVLQTSMKRASRTKWTSLGGSSHQQRLSRLISR